MSGACDGNVVIVMIIIIIIIINVIITIESSVSFVLPEGNPCFAWPLSKTCWRYTSIFMIVCMSCCFNSTQCIVVY